MLGEVSRSSTHSRGEWGKEDFGLERVVCTVKRECWLAIGGVQASKKWQKEEASPAATSQSSREKRKNMELGKEKKHTPRPWSSTIQQCTELREFSVQLEAHHVEEKC
ncbi:hypothetical protein LR48_Vigan05g121500 [Vigna angularis]|uniref:Uncharacterized protein n=1 Tax=Phaseolus angularis TaxID=3914 RepID=A0A0L9UL39_PHAAN|nr:hypothetical protein LR48_Vigan05g121500 [Vigna angularis]